MPKALNARQVKVDYDDIHAAQTSNARITTEKYTNTRKS